MASIIRIKRSSVSGNPATLGAGELAYSALTDNGSNGGDRLYIGIGTETSGNAANHFVIGGKYFTDMLDHTAGVLTASSALIVDSNKKLDELLVDNLSLNGNTVSATGDIVLSSTTGVVLQTTEFISGGSYGGNRLYLPTGGGATLQSGYEGGVTLRASTNNTDWATVNLAASGALSVPGTITTASNGNLSLTPNGTGKLVLSNPYIGDTSTTLAEYIYDTVGGAVTGTANQISVTNSDAGNTSTIALINTAVTAGSYGSATAIPTFTVDAQGRLTAASTASITTSLGIAGDTGTDTIALATDTITFAGGTGLTSTVNSGTNTVTFDIDSTVATLTGTQTLTNKTISGASNTLSNIGNGSLTNSAVTIGSTSVSLGATVTTFAGLASVTSTSFVGALTGNASTATTLQTARAINGVNFDGSAAITVTAAAGTLSGNTLNSGVTASSLTSVGTIATGVWQGTAIGNAYLANSSVTIGSTSISLGSTSTSLAGVTELTVDNINVNGNTISSTDTNGNIIISPNGTGKVDVSGSIITGLSEPVGATDAATKNYVDTVAQGLHVHEAAHCATTDTLAVLSGGTVTYANGTAGVGATLTLSAGLSAIDGHTLTNGDRILVKNQANQAHNGMYVRTSATVLTRASDFDTGAEIGGGDFTFVENGTVYGNTGWVQTFEVVTVGTDTVIWQQFSGTGTFTAGNGLTISGTEFNVVGTADRITANVDSIDIASTYVGQSTITTLGTIGTGVWQGTIINPTYGGTGVNNGSKTITLGGNFTHTGAHTLGLTTTANTSVTLPTTGTLATLAGTESFSNKTFSNTTNFSGNVTGAGAATSTLDGFNIDGGTY